jgi:hypothetical protein
MNYYNFWSWVLLYAALVICLPLLKLFHLGIYTWNVALAPVWIPWLLSALGACIVLICRLVQAWRPVKGGVL